jgi:RNA polymerase sigma-70 factor (ECF subfamily)
MAAVNFQSELYELKNVLHGFAYKLTRNQNDSKDLYQETAYRALRNKDKFRAGTNLKAWLFTIMRNIFINNYRKKVKRNTILDSTDNDFYINSGSTAVLNDANSNILMGELKAMINSLAENIKTPFMMYYYGYKYQEIADQLDLPLGTVKSRIFFARKELKKNINKNYSGVIHRG